MKKRQIIEGCAIAAMALLGSAGSFAQDIPDSSQNHPAMYLQYGSAEHGTDAWTLGATIPWRQWNHRLGGGMLTGYWDVWGSRWSARHEGSDRSTWVVGAKPTLRWRPDQGRSPWFAEAGLGVSYAANRRYITDHKEFSTRFNFASHIGVGYLFGEQLKNEISLRLEHHSNAGIKEPNPGENFLQVRYGRRF
jgi:hypothetical protein